MHFSQSWCESCIHRDGFKVAHSRMDELFNGIRYISEGVDVTETRTNICTTFFRPRSAFSALKSANNIMSVTVSSYSFLPLL